MRKLLDSENRRLVYIKETADEAFWDRHWEIDDLRKLVTSVSKHNMFVRTMKKYLAPSEGSILEGGCGIGQMVWAFSEAGYDCIGIDYASKTIEKVNASVPEIDVRLGDVRRLDFDDGFFAGYWSFGVIEHFYDGFDEVMFEMKRVLKPGGYLFLTFPHFNFARRVKASKSKFRQWVPEQYEESDFYQFAFDHKKIIEKFQKCGFSFVRRRAIGGIYGLGDEVCSGKTFERISSYKKKSLLFRGIREVIDSAFALFAGHSILLIFNR